MVSTQEISLQSRDNDSFAKKERVSSAYCAPHRWLLALFAALFALLFFALRALDHGLSVGFSPRAHVRRALVSSNAHTLIINKTSSNEESAMTMAGRRLQEEEGQEEVVEEDLTPTEAHTVRIAVEQKIGGIELNTYYRQYENNNNAFKTSIVMCSENMLSADDIRNLAIAASSSQRRLAHDSEITYYDETEENENDKETTHSDGRKLLNAAVTLSFVLSLTSEHSASALMRKLYDCEESGKFAKYLHAQAAVVGSRPLRLVYSSSLLMTDLLAPSAAPSEAPSLAPAITPYPTVEPSIAPSRTPSQTPSLTPTYAPSTFPPTKFDQAVYLASHVLKGINYETFTNNYEANSFVVKCAAAGCFKESSPYTVYDLVVSPRPRETDITRVTRKLADNSTASSAAKTGDASDGEGEDEVNREAWRRAMEASIEEESDTEEERQKRKLLWVDSIHLSYVVFAWRGNFGLSVFRECVRSGVFRQNLVRFGKRYNAPDMASCYSGAFTSEYLDNPTVFPTSAPSSVPSRPPV